MQRGTRVRHTNTLLLSKNFYKSLAGSKFTTNFALSDMTWLLRIIFWGQTLVTAPNKARNILSFSFQPGESSPCSLKQNENTVRYWTTHTVQIASLLPSLDLMMPSGKLCSRWPKGNEKYYTARKPISSARDSNVPNQTERIVGRSGGKRGLGKGERQKKRGEGWGTSAFHAFLS